MDFALANKPIPALSAASRWMIFSQGIVDFAIYGVVEYKVKRDVRRKVSLVFLSLSSHIYMYICVLAFPLSPSPRS